MDETKEINMNQIVNLDKAAYHKATAKSYLMLSNSLDSFKDKMHYMNAAKKQLELAKELLK